MVFAMLSILILYCSPKDFFLRNLHAVADVGKHRWLDVVPFGTDLFATAHQASTFFLACSNVAHHTLELVGIAEWALWCTHSHRPVHVH